MPDEEQLPSDDTRWLRTRGSGQRRARPSRTSSGRQKFFAGRQVAVRTGAPLIFKVFFKTVSFFNVDLLYQFVNLLLLSYSSFKY